MNSLDRLTAALSDRYQIEREIGAGGMATVYLARDLKHDRLVAVKVLKPEVASSIGADRFLREIRTTANLTHPHILPLHDSGEVDGHLFFVMPFVEGETLQDRLERESQLPIEDAVRIAGELAGALSYAHERGIIHRDVKPANVLLEAGHAVLADFGISHAVAAVKETRLTETGMSLGTPHYMSPEQITGEPQLDGRADQYALGCVLFEMLVGQPPFAGTSQAVLRQHLAADAPAVTLARPSVPEPVSQAVARSLAKSPADRFRTAEEMKAALAGVVVPFRGRGVSGRVKAVAYASTILLALATVAVLASIWPRGDEGPPLVSFLLPDTAGLDPEDARFAVAVAQVVHTRLSLASAFDIQGERPPDHLAIRNMTDQQIGEVLESDYLLRFEASRASYTNESAGMQITASLGRSSDGVTEWKKVFDLGRSDSVSGQPLEVAEHVARALDSLLARSDQEALSASLTDDPEAMEYFRLGDSILKSGNHPDINRRAAELYAQAVAADTTFGLGYARLARALFYLNEDSTIARGRDALARARGIDPSMPEILFAEGALHFGRGEYRQAVDLWGGYLERRPNHAQTLYLFSMASRRLGNWEDALDAGTLAVKRDPLAAAWWFELAMTTLSLRRYSEVPPLVRKWADLAPNNASTVAWSQAWLALVDRGDVAGAERTFLQLAEQVGDDAVLGMLVRREWLDFWFGLPDWGFRPKLEGRTAPEIGVGDPFHFFLARAVSAQAEGDSGHATMLFDSASVDLENWMEQFSGTPLGHARLHGALGVAYAGAGRKTDALREAEVALRIHPLAQDQYYGLNILTYRLRIFMLVGEYERAIDELERLLEIPSYYSATWARVHPFFAPLRDHPRFQALLERYADDVEH